jgi:DNA excision repair protein ERCC-3
LKDTKRQEHAPVTDGPLIVQSDKTLLLEVEHPLSDDARTAIAPFAELERAPEHVHTYRITPLALWNARAAGHDAEQVVDALVRYSRYPVPQPLLVDVVDTMGRFGRLQLTNHPAHGLVLNSLDRAVLEEVLRHKKVKPMLGARVDDDTVVVHPSERGRLKQLLLKVGWPGTSTARPTRSTWSRTAGSCATTSAGPRRRSGRAARAWSCCRAARARRWSARPRWPRRARPR